MGLEMNFHSNVSKLDSVYLSALDLMFKARKMAAIYEEHKDICSQYVHSTSKGHEAIQLAMAFQLNEKDGITPYYRDDSVLLGLGFTPYDLMLQLLGKRDDLFSGGRTYYAHPSVKSEGFPLIPHQSSATGMQAIPATGMAQGIKYLDEVVNKKDSNRIVICSLGDGAVTEGEVAEAFQMAVLKKLPIIYVVQDNHWGISATGSEMRAMDAYEFARGFKGMGRVHTDGADFDICFNDLRKVVKEVRKKRHPYIVHAECPLLGHHTSGVRKEWYRPEIDLKVHEKLDPLPKLVRHLIENGYDEEELNSIKINAESIVINDFERAIHAPDPDIESFDTHVFAETSVVSEKGNRVPENSEKVVMVDAALHAIDEILSQDKKALLYGQDVGGRLGGVFREAATLTKKYGHDRVFNTPIQEAYIIGSTAGMSAVGLKPIVEVQFADYIWPGMNQLVEELSKSCYLSQGKFPIQSLIRVPIGSYGGGGPYHSGSIESTLANIRGIKVVYPSNTADMKGLMKAAYLDPNPVVMLEHKGLYWSKVKGTGYAKMVEPDIDYVLPLGKANIVRGASQENIDSGESVLVICYGMGVHWTLNAGFEGVVEILDLRTINPVDWDMIETRTKVHGKVLLITEEPLMNSFIESLAGRISEHLFKYLDAPVMTIGSANLPAIPLNRDLESQMLPNTDKVAAKIRQLLDY